MVAKRDLRSSQFRSSARTRLRRRTRRLAGATALAITAALVGGAAPSLADTGSVYFDSHRNVAAGEPGHLFNGTFNGFNNVGIGDPVMPDLTAGQQNTAIGTFALTANTDGSSNFASGFDSLNANTSGNTNVAVVANALASNTTASDNVATGFDALITSATGHDNVASGYRALFNVSAGSSNIAIGSNAGEKLTTGSENVYIASVGRAGESGTTRIGRASNQTRAFLAGVSGTSIPGSAQPVVVNANGQLGTASAANKGAGAAKSDRKLSQLRAEVEALRRQVGREGAELQRLRASGH
jgi:hypothetical protein